MLSISDDESDIISPVKTKEKKSSEKANDTTDAGEGVSSTEKLDATNDATKPSETVEPVEIPIEPGKPNYVYVNTGDEDSMVVQFVLAVRKGKRELIPDPPPNPKSPEVKKEESEATEAEEKADGEKEASTENENKDLETTEDDAKMETDVKDENIENDDAKAIETEKSDESETKPTTEEESIAVEPTIDSDSEVVAVETKEDDSEIKTENNDAEIKSNDDDTVNEEPKVEKTDDEVEDTDEKLPIEESEVEKSEEPLPMETDAEPIKETEQVDEPEQKLEDETELDAVEKMDVTEENKSDDKAADDTEKDDTSSKDDADDEDKPEPVYIDVEEYYVKYRNFSYLHCEWRTEEELLRGDRRVSAKIRRFQMKQAQQMNIFDNLEEDPFNPDFVETDRVLDMSIHEDPVTGKKTRHFLVKWKSLAYEDSTWEVEDDVEEKKIEEYVRFNTVPPKDKWKPRRRPKPEEWKKLDVTPIYKNNNSLRPYQLEGLNWLKFSWYNSHNCILADEMGLGKTVSNTFFFL